MCDCGAITFIYGSHEKLYEIGKPKFFLLTHFTHQTQYIPIILIFKSETSSTFNTFAVIEV